jgi:hypothetical protein
VEFCIGTREPLAHHVNARRQVHDGVDLVKQTLIPHRVWPDFSREAAVNGGWQSLHRRLRADRGAHSEPLPDQGCTEMTPDKASSSGN